MPADTTATAVENRRARIGNLRVDHVVSRVTVTAVR
jgi:hypothetical protein